MQLADVYVATRTIGLAAEAAAWRVAEDLPAEDDLAVAAYWFAVEGPAALHVCHHVHGGMGVDITYPLHRRSRRGSRTSARQLGGTAATLAAVPVLETDGKNLELEPGAARVQGARPAPTSRGCSSPEDRRTLLTERHGDTYHRIIKQMGADGWMGVGWPDGVRRPRARRGGAAGLRQRGRARRRAPAGGDAADRRADADGARHREAEGDVPRRHPHRRRALRHRLQRARRRHRPGLAALPAPGATATTTSSTARRCGPPAATPPTTSGSRCAPIPTPPSTAASRCSSSTPATPATPGRRSSPPTAPTTSTRPTTTTSACPVDMLVGEENQGWRLITSQLNHERVMLAPAGRFEGLRDLVRDWARAPDRPGRPAGRRAAGRPRPAGRR